MKNMDYSQEKIVLWIIAMIIAIAGGYIILGAILMVIAFIAIAKAG